MKALQQSGQPIPPPLRIRGLLDAGADATALSAACAVSLGLTPVARVSTQTAAGSIMVNQHEISFSILGPTPTGAVVSVRPNLRVTEWLHPEHGLDALVGMDVLLEGLLILDGPGQQFTLAFDVRLVPKMPAA
jgi:hypothetical protein